MMNKRLQTALILMLVLSIASGCSEREIVPSEESPTDTTQIANVENQTVTGDVDMSKVVTCKSPGTEADEVVTIIYDDDITQSTNEVVTITFDEDIITESADVAEYTITETETTSQVDIDSVSIIGHGTGEDVVTITISGEGPLNETLTHSEPEKIEIIEIDKEIACLDTIPTIDFGENKLDPQIEALASSAGLHLDNEYSLGLVADDSSIIVTNWFKGDIIGDIGIGTDISKVKDVLGPPSFEISNKVSNKVSNMIFYKGKFNYIGFTGVETVREAVVLEVINQYDNEIMLDSINMVRDEDTRLSDSYRYHPSLNLFYDAHKYVNENPYESGYERFYTISSGGIEIEEGMERIIVVYNNYEGRMYSIPNDPSGVEIRFLNKDSNVERLVESIRSYESRNLKFKTKGVVSPSGKRSYIYDGMQGDLNQIVVRTTNHSKCDYTFTSRIDTFEWINDDYFIGTHVMSGEPVIYSVVPIGFDMPDYLTIKLFESAGYKPDQNDAFETYYHVIEVNDEFIRVESKSMEHILNFEITFKEDGWIKFIGFKEE